MNTLYLILLVICLVFSAFFSSSETAFISLQRFRLQRLIDSKARGVALVARMLEKPERLLSTILLGNTLVNTAASALATVVAIALLGDKYGALLATIVMTIILLIFAETTPKTIAAHYSESMALIFARPLRLVSTVFAPFVQALSWIAFAFTRMLGETKTARLLVSEEEIRTMISVGAKEGVVEDDAAKMLHKVFELGDSPVREVMVPRLDVVAIQKGSRISDFLELYARSPMSRFPVYDGTLDNVVGVLAIKDVMMGLATDSINNDSLIDELARQALFVPQTKMVNELLVEMREKNSRLAVVVDEYGGTAGIVSLTSLAEEITGPVRDELGVMDKEYEVLDEHTFQVDGGMRVDEVNEAMGLELPEGEDYETVAGLIMKVMGRIPKQGDSLRYRGLRIVVTRMEGTKIEEVLITRERPGRGEGGTAAAQPGSDGGGLSRS
jgi:putative hemolysin